MPSRNYLSKESALAYLLIALGAVLRLLRLNAVPGINGDEVYWAVAIDDAIGGKIGLLITPSGRWPDLVTIINGLWGWLCKQLAFGEGAHRYGYASVNLLASLSIYWITKPNFGKGFAYILCAFCLVSPSLIEMLFFMFPTFKFNFREHRRHYRFLLKEASNQ